MSYVAMPEAAVIMTNEGKLWRWHNEGRSHKTACVLVQVRSSYEGSRKISPPCREPSCDCSTHWR